MRQACGLGFANMTRIIGGLAGSLQLTAPAKTTRPTSDRVRESIFNRLEAQDRLTDAKVLDLFAGTGALGLEALSRGASGVQLVEQARQAAIVCQKNCALITASLRKQGQSPSAEVASQDATVFASLAAQSQAQYDLVFIDPPYEYSNEALESLLAKLLGGLNTDALVLVERAARTPQFELPEGYRLELAKSYGDTTVYWLEA